MRAGRVLVVAAPTLLIASLAVAQSTPPPADAKKPSAEAGKPAAPPAAPASAAAGGLVVFVDPVTGKIRQPDPAEIGALTALRAGAPAASPAAAEPLQIFSLPGGGEAVRLDRSFESAIVMTKTPDGKLVTTCVTGEERAQEAVAAGSKAARKENRREAADVH